MAGEETYPLFHEKDWEALWAIARSHPQQKAAFLQLANEMHAYDKAVWHNGRNPDVLPPERLNLIDQIGLIVKDEQQFSRDRDPLERIAAFMDGIRERHEAARHARYVQFSRETKPPLDHHASTTESGVSFQTGQPVTFPTIRNTVPSAKRVKGTPDSFQQDIEPHGAYLLHDGQGAAKAGRVPAGWQSGHVTFNKPLVVSQNTIPGGRIYDENSWKQRLARQYGKTGKHLSAAIAKDGHDGIVTVHHSGETSEIVDLRHLHDNWKPLSATPQSFSRSLDEIGPVEFSAWTEDEDTIQD